MRCCATARGWPVVPSGRRRRASSRWRPVRTRPIPYALFELSRDLRPPDYATLFVRMAVESSGLDEPIAVAAVVRPPWLAAVVDELGVMTCSVRERWRVYAQATV